MYICAYISVCTYVHIFTHIYIYPYIILLFNIHEAILGFNEWGSNKIFIAKD